MKRTILTLAAFAFLVCAAFAVSAGTPVFEEASVAVKESPSVLQSNNQLALFQELTAFEHAKMALVSNKTWVATSVGVMPLNIFRRPFDTVMTCDGYSDELLRPKINTIIEENRNSQNRFTGLWGDHFARADV